MRLKRTEAPKFWPIERKTALFTIAVRPGPHARSAALPLGLILRDTLAYASTLSEAKIILNGRHVRVDGIVRTDHRFPVGLMDVVAVGEEQFRILPGRKGLELRKIAAPDAGMKLLKVTGKRHLTKGRTQLSFHDGKTMVVDKDSYQTKDTVVYDVATRTIARHLKLRKSAVALIIKGTNMGTTGRIAERLVTRTPQPNVVILDVDQKQLSVPEDYIFVVGEDKPAIAL